MYIMYVHKVYLCMHACIYIYINLGEAAHYIHMHKSAYICIYTYIST
jgi:hypothetical protein